MGFFDKLLGGGKKTPFAPDAQNLAREQELLSRFNINTSTGSRSFTKDASGRDVLNIEETPFQQQQRARQEALAGDFLSSLAGGDDRFSAESKRIGDLTFERGLSRLQPTLEKARRRTETQLATQGLPEGSEAQRSAIDELSRGENDLYTALAQEAELAAGQEQNRLRNLANAEALSFFGDQFGGIDNSFFGNVADVDRAGIVQTGFNQQLDRAAQEATRQNTQRSNAFQMASALTGGLGNFLQNGGGQSSGVGGAPAPKSSGGGLSDFFSPQNLGKLMTMFSSASDIRLKENIKYHGTVNGYKLYDFNYLNDNITYRGVMAQEVMEVMPEAVVVMDNGFYWVYYDKLGLQMEVVR